MCPFSWVLDIRVCLELALVLVVESIIDLFFISRSSWVWFSVSLESVGAFLLLDVFSMSISSMILFILLLWVLDVVFFG